MNRLWAPWRRGYVTKKVKEKGCLFCSKQRSRNDAKNFVLARSHHAFSLLNIYPYHNGHVMIAPKRHVNDLDHLTAEELLDLTQHLILIKKRLKQVLHPSGFNVGINLGKAAGAGIIGHVHIHVVPRWEGDYNFMPVFSDTKIISDSLKSLYAQLAHVDKKTSRGKRK